MLPKYSHFEQVRLAPLIPSVVRILAAFLYILGLMMMLVTWAPAPWHPHFSGADLCTWRAAFSPCDHLFFLSFVNHFHALTLGKASAPPQLLTLDESRRVRHLWRKEGQNLLEALGC